ncbi:hypothetical protein PHSC3_000638 [Chlamydiales bacterium STE3]|nr:hypothetical protein PHSC3_000638 [Chlamydiales bacterium STE3]
MKIAVLGAGFCGIAVAWNLLQFKNCHVDLYDPKGVGGESSKIAAGLFHKYTGAHAKLNRFAIEGESATLDLLKVATEESDKPIILSRGILRVALTEEKKLEYANRASQYKDCRWLDSEAVFALTNGAQHHPGLLIETGLTIDCVSYMSGLWKACKKLKADFYQQSIADLDELRNYDAVVVATGAKLPLFEALKSLCIKPIKGQLLEFEWPDTSPLPLSLNSEAYITMKPDSMACFVGSTFERQFECSEPDFEVAKNLLFPKMAALYPPLCNSKVIGCRAGLRASTPDHLPIIGQFGHNLFAITGMGSKGLLYHAFYAKQLSQLIKTQLLC